MKDLPIGISTLSIIRKSDMVYVDKTKAAYSLIKKVGRFFLSRPRRFGKSLFLDTLREIFEGNEELFKGLYIHDHWDWSKKYPVITVDFAGGVLRNETDFENKLNAVFNRYADIHSITYREKGVSNLFAELIMKLSGKYNSKVVVLIDEYDKPMLDNIEDLQTALLMKNLLKNFYSVMKEQDRNLQFVLLTGVSKFSKVNIFSGINNLKDITLSEEYATICGYTQKDLESTFGEHLSGVDWEKLKRWYNGYSFSGEPVYNPFDILLFISDKKNYRNYWFDTGTPSFLIKLLQKKCAFLPDLDNIEVSEELLGSFEIDQIEPTTLLFQSGYLTIKEQYKIMDRPFYKLGFPNLEVKISFNEHLIQAYSGVTSDKLYYEKHTYDALMKGDLKALEQTIIRLFASIPHRAYTNNQLLAYEGYYASVLYAFFSAVNCRIIPEDITNHGQADMTVELGDNIYVMEIKTMEVETIAEETPNPALEQIKANNYAEKYLSLPGKTVFQVGMIFSRKTRNLIRFDFCS